MKVWVDEWQLACCGDAFRVGEEIEWTARKGSDARWLEDSGVDDIEYHEDHHSDPGDGIVVIRGRVKRIQAVSCEYERVAGKGEMLYPVPGSARLADVTIADCRPAGDLAVTGYVVELDATGEPFPWLGR